MVEVVPNPLKKVKKAVSNVDDGLKRALEVAGLPVEAAAKVAEVAAQGAKDYYNKKPKAGSQPLTDADMDRAMDIGTGMAGGTIDWLGGSINAARAAEMAAARVTGKAPSKVSANYDKVFNNAVMARKDIEDEIKHWESLKSASDSELTKLLGPTDFRENHMATIGYKLADLAEKLAKAKRIEVSLRAPRGR